MKAMVLAAGLGVRMRPLTLLRAKPVLPVLGRPLLHWTLERLRLHGVREVLINLHYLPETVREVVGDGRALGLSVTYSLEPEILGTGGGPRKARAWLGAAPFLLVNGDVLFDFDLTRLVQGHLASGARATLALKPNPDPRRYGPVVTGSRGRLLSLAGRPRPARGLVSLFTGVHVLDPALLDRLPPGRSDTVRDLYRPLIAGGEGRLLRGVRVRGAWYDLGSPAVYLASQVSMLRSGVFGRSSSCVRVHPEARVAADARVEETVIGAGATVEAGVRLRRSVVWPGVRVGRKARVTDSVVAGPVGPGAVVYRQVVTPRRRVGLR